MKSDMNIAWSGRLFLDRIQAQYGRPIGDWEKETRRRLAADFDKRKLPGKSGQSSGLWFLLRLLVSVGSRMFLLFSLLLSMIILVVEELAVAAVAATS